MFNVKILYEKFLDLIFVKFGEAGPVELNVQIILGSIKVANSLSISIHHYVLFVLCLYVVLVLSHYVNVSVLIKFSQKTSVFTLIIISSP